VFTEGGFAAAYRKFSYVWSMALLIFALVIMYHDVSNCDAAFCCLARRCCSG
jgi:hypothetical protein